MNKCNNDLIKHHIRTVLYLRLSKEDLEKESVSESIKNQELLLRDFAKIREYLITEVYIDDDYSGLTEERPAFQKMIKDAYEHKFDIILSKNQARFSRNMIQIDQYLHEIFPQLGIRFIGVLDGVDTDERRNKKSRQIYALTNEWYCEDLSENIRMVFKRKMFAGQNLAAYAPFGYFKNEFDHHKLDIDEKNAEIVRYIYSEYINGKRIIEIKRQLDKLQIPTPMMIRNQTNEYRKWSTSTIRKILTNETYIGTLVQGMSERISYKNRKLRNIDPSKWIKIENHHEAIIDKKVFETIQNRIKKRKKI